MKPHASQLCEAGLPSCVISSLRYCPPHNSNILSSQNLLGMLQELGLNPYALLWLRYTTFIVLYPLGVASELTMVYLALPHIQKTHLWSIQMPNAANFAFDYYLFCLIAVIIYLPGTSLLLCLSLLSCAFHLQASSITHCACTITPCNADLMIQRPLSTRHT